MNNTDILLIGHIAKDQIIVDGQASEQPGGAVYFGGMALRRLGLRVTVVTRLHKDDFGLLAPLRQAGIQVFAQEAPETSGIANSYRSANMERRETALLGFAGAIPLADIPDISASIYAVAPIMAGEVTLPVLKALARRGPVSLDVQGFVRVPQGRDLVFRPWEEMAEGLAQVRYLKVDRAEAELLTGEQDLRQAAHKLAAYGPQEIVLTQSSGVTVYAGGEIVQAPFHSRSLAGRTGRGDTCFMSYLGKRLQGLPPHEAACWAAAVTSLKQEQPGPWNGDMAAAQAWLAKHCPPQE